MKRLTIVGLFLFGLGCFGGGGSTSATVLQQPTGVGAATIEIDNISNETIYYVYMSPTQQSTWGPDLLGSNVLQRGQRFTLSNIQPGTWDLRVVDRSRNYKEWRNFTVEAGGGYRLQVSAGSWRHD